MIRRTVCSSTRVTTQYNTASNLVANIRPCHRYWPIPADQVANSHGALDNKEYGE